MLVRAVRAVLVLIVSALTLFGAPLTAFAAWSPPVSDGAILLGYGAAYGGCVHKGVDLRARTGEVVSSPVDGTVTFAGSVPADGGGTCTAVTIETADGLRVTLLPLSGSCLSSGSVIHAGDEVGPASSAGDSSSAEAHVHLSLRRGETYLDPTGLLPASAASSPEPASSPVPVTPTAPAPPTAPVGSPGTSPAASLTGMSSSPVAQAVMTPQAEPEPVTAHSVRMPRDAQEEPPLMLHSAPAARIRGVRLPSAVAAPSVVLLALALAAAAMILAVRLAPRHALDRT